MAQDVPIRNDWPAVQDHSRDYHRFSYVYPVISRRSAGLSLGINLNPDKRCNFDCIYCEVDRRTPPRTTRLDLEQMQQELQQMVAVVQSGELGREPKFADLPEPVTRTIQDLAFSGDGEPTLVPCFAEAVRRVATVRSQAGLHAAKIVLITDAAGLDKRDVRVGLGIMDANNGEVWGKLDAGTADYYRRINRTLVRFDRILQNLTRTAQERPLVIQSLFLRVHGEPMPPAELNAYCDRLQSITEAGGHIREVHAYTVARATPEPFATRLEPSVLESIGATIRQRTGLTVNVFP